MRRFVPLCLLVALVATACDRGETATTTTSVPEEATTTTAPVIVTTSTTLPEETTTTLPPSPVIAREGDKSETVLAVQFLLECLGYADLTVDGNFGPATKTAVQAAQTALGLEATGAPTEDLFGALSRVCTQQRPVEPEDETPVAVVGYTAVGDPEVFPISLLFGATLTVQVISGPGVIVVVKDSLGNLIPSVDGITFPIPESGEYDIEVSTPADPVFFTIAVIDAPGAGSGDWIITTDGIEYKGTKFTLGTAAKPLIDKIFEGLDHGVRSKYGEFDTGWNDPAQPGFRGIMIEGLAFLFHGPDADNPGRPETFIRVRYVGPSFDKDDNPRPAGWVQTLSGITVGNSLADLKETYGSNVKPGSDTVGHYWRFGTTTGREVCFYFGKTAPTDASKIVEISTECRG